MKRSIILSLIMVLFATPLTWAASNQLYTYNNSNETQQTAALQWCLKIGKCTENPLLLPNGNILLTIASQQLLVSPAGQIIWVSKSSQGNLGQAVIDTYGSIYAASASSIQETLPNGARGWTFTSFPSQKTGKNPMLTQGPNKLLYLPLIDALYAVDTQGHYVWSLFPWDNAETYSTKTTAKREFIACTGDEQAVYIVYGEKSGYRLTTVDQQGKFLWSYWLGDVSKCYLLADGQGKVYASVSYKKSTSQRPGQSSSKSKLLPAKLFCFQYSSNKPLWEQSLKIEKELTAPVLNGNSVYVSANSELNAYQAGTGTLLWYNRLLKLVSPVAISPVNGRIYAGSSEGVLYALNTSGKMIWERKLDGAIERAPLITSDGTIYLVTSKGSLFKINDAYKET